jgi:hypothetical protein
MVAPQPRDLARDEVPTRRGEELQQQAAVDVAVDEVGAPRAAPPARMRQQEQAEILVNRSGFSGSTSA